MKKELILAAGLLTSGCIAPVEFNAFTTPAGIVYLRGSENDPAIVAHEEQHWEDYQNDPLFFWKYQLSQEYRCEAEKRANLSAKIFPIDSHPACEEGIMHEKRISLSAD